MIDPRHGASAGVYEALLLQVIKKIAELGWQVVLVNHEGSGDLALVERLEAQSPVSTHVVRGGCGLHLKGVLGGAHAVIASRFHAIVSSLTQNIPVIGTGWSHKYHELFKDFGIEDLLIKVEDGASAILGILEDLDHGERYRKIVTKIEAGNAVYCKEAKELWNALHANLVSR
jgi:colanic acid/amylovoran biosynthesis protein